MPRTVCLALLLLVSAASSAIAGTDAHTRYAWPVVGVTDGDTLTIVLPGLPAPLNPVAVRLRRADAPESGGRAKCAAERELAEQATRFTRRAIATARRIEFAQPRWDKYGGRIDAEVWVDGESLADRLIAAGLARHYDGGRRGGWC